MELRILGPLEVVRDGTAVSLGGPKQRAVLAVLLLHRGEVVSLDRLVDALWGEVPPPTAAKSVQVYVSQLRKALGNGALQTHGRGYAFRLSPHALDAQQFEALLERAREQLADGDTAEAAATLRASLDLWRGPAFADFADEEFARTEIARLEELRLAAVEERIEADLRLGGGSELVPELESLVHRHPFRERFRGQLMLALYRAGRQADALDSYRLAREHLVEELGLEPGPQLQSLERAILNQDPKLDPSERPDRRPARAAPRRRRRGAVVLSVGLCVVAAAVAVPVALRDDGANHSSVAVVANSVVAIDPATNTAVGDVAVGNAPSSIVVGEEAAWVLNADDHTISKIDPTTMRGVKTFATASEPTDLAVGEGALWVGNGVPVTSSEFWATLDPVGLTRIDPVSTVVTDRVALPASAGGELVRRGTGQRQIAVGGGAVWAAEPDGTLWRIDAKGPRAVADGSGLEARALAFGERGLWIVGDTSVALLNTESEKIDLEVPISTITLGAVAADAGSVWVTDPIAGALWRIDPSPKPTTRTIAVGAGAWSVAAGAGAVWVANTIDGTVLRVDPATDRVVARIHLGATPHEIAVGAGRVWVSVGGTSRVPSGASAAAQAVGGAVPSSSCGPVSYGGTGQPDLLIASDLPLQTGQRGVTFPMSQAIEFVLASHRFRAGRFSVGYQSCDDATVQAGGWDPAKCAGNAEMYAAAPKVIAVIGPYHSGCAALELPILNQAPNGPLALVSPANSWPGLTREFPGAEPGELEHLYPTGVRNYARVGTSDDYQAAADAQLARDLGLRRVFVVQDGGSDPWISMIADSFRRAAGLLGVDVVGSATWAPDADSFGGLVAQVAATRPDGVFLAGIVFDGAGPLVKELRAALGPDAPIIAPDAFSALPYLRKVAGPAATGMYVSVLGLPDQALGRAGKRFLRSFSGTQPGGVPSYTASYGAQAAEVVLAAIARSDGTRASVSKQLFDADVEDGILGTFRIDGNGDPSLQPVTILRVAADDVVSPTLLADHAGSVIDRVITPSPDLVR